MKVTNNKRRVRTTPKVSSDLSHQELTAAIPKGTRNHIEGMSDNTGLSLSEYQRSFNSLPVEIRLQVASDLVITATKIQLFLQSVACTDPRGQKVAGYGM